MGRQAKGPTPERAQRIAKVLELRIEGYTFQQIADKLGVSVKTAHKDFRTGIDRTVCDNAESYLHTELGRLESLHRAMWPLAMAGDHKAVSELLEISKRRMKILGIDTGLLSSTGDRSVREHVRDAILQALGD